jgi:hypothetical protein
MTAEIAILNKSAVALAADSALTVGYGEELKTYNTHKLFRLSEANPVGVMIFNNANLLTASWETIIKDYRKKNGEKTFDHLFDYGNDLLAFLQDNEFFFPRDVQDYQAIRDVLSGLIFIRDLVDKGIMALGKKVKLADIAKVVQAFIESTFDVLDKAPTPGYPADHKRAVYSRYAGAIELVIAEVFQTLPLTRHLRKKLRRIGLLLLLAPNNITGDYTGLVVAGFGEQDLHPSLQAFQIHSVVLGKLRWMTEKTHKIKFGQEAVIQTFAQKEVVQGFMNGIHPDVGELMMSSIRKQLDESNAGVLKALPKMSAKNKASVEEAMKKGKEGFETEFVKEMHSFARKNISDPVVRAVAVLPKEELATMAETLVNLTSFRRRVTLDMETVGGPIDVAVISRGDGFIWMKRRQYFDAQLNPQFLKNYT